MSLPMPYNHAPIHITTLDDERVAMFAKLTEAQLQATDSTDDCHSGLFIAESPKVIMTALYAGMKPVALLCEERHITGDAAPVIEQCGGIPIYTGERELLRQLTGYTLTRGVLCAMQRPILPTVEEICHNARRVAVIDNVSDTTNIGAIFRSAAALGIDAILLTHGSCAPLNRRSVRVSMGSVFLIPWTWLDHYDQLRNIGFRTAAMALSDNSINIDDLQLKAERRLAIILGTEGDGLPKETINQADYVVRIPMYHGVDSLNVAAAAAVAFWEINQAL